jgi:DNA sulfur modification protein DndB
MRKVQWCVPALRGLMGDWVYYSTLLNAEMIEESILSSHEIRESKELGDFLQREVKPRVIKIAKYLVQSQTRFFNSIIVGIFDSPPGWHELDLSSLKSSMDKQQVLVLEESLGILSFTGKEKMFAIDGQHRVEGIKKAFDANKERIREDQYSVIFIAHIDSAEGKVRTRRLFCDINKNAVAVSQGDKVIIDEDDLSAVVTRQVYAKYPHFKKGKVIAITEQKEELREKKGPERFTNLLTLYTVTKKLMPLRRKERGAPQLRQESISEFVQIVFDFFDFVIKHEKSLKKYFSKQRGSLAVLRSNNRNLLFRPVGLEILARLYAHFAQRGDLKTLSQGLRKLKFSSPGGVFDGILWIDGKIDAHSKAKTAAVHYCLYLLGQLSPEKSHLLRDRLAEILKDPRFSLPESLILAPSRRS